MTDLGVVLNMVFKSAGIVADDHNNGTQHHQQKQQQQQQQQPYALSDKGDLLFVKDRKWTPYEYEENYQLYLRKLSEHLNPQVQEKIKDHESRHPLGDDLVPKVLGQGGAFRNVYALTEEERWRTTATPNGEAGQRAALKDMQRAFFTFNHLDQEEQSIYQGQDEPEEEAVSQDEDHVVEVAWDSGLDRTWTFDQPFPSCKEKEDEQKHRIDRPKTAVTIRPRSSQFVGTGRNSSTAAFEEAQFQRRLEMVDSFVRSGGKHFVGTKVFARRRGKSEQVVDIPSRPSSAPANRRWSTSGHHITPSQDGADQPLYSSSQQSEQSKLPRRPEVPSLRGIRSDYENVDHAEEAVSTLSPPPLARTNSVDEGGILRDPEQSPTTRPRSAPASRGISLRRRSKQQLDAPPPPAQPSASPSQHSAKRPLSATFRRPKSASTVAPASRPGLASRPGSASRPNSASSHQASRQGSFSLSGWMQAASRPASASSVRPSSANKARLRSGSLLTRQSSLSSIAPPGSEDESADELDELEKRKREFRRLLSAKSAAPSANARAPFMTDKLDAIIGRLMAKRELQKKSFLGKRKPRKSGKNKHKKTLERFIEAALDGHYQLVLDLLEDEVRPFGPNEVNSEGRTAVFACVLQAMQKASNSSEDTVLEQLTRTRGVSWSSGVATPFWASDRNRHDIVLRILLQRGGNILFQETNGVGWGLIHHAVNQNRPDYVAWLLENGMSVDLPTTKDFQTPLMVAVKTKRYQIMVQLIKHRCDVDAQDLRGNTALHHAAKANNIKAAYLLLVAGASKLLRNTQRRTPLDEAIFRRFTKITDMMTLFTFSDLTMPELLDFAEQQLVPPS